MNIGKEQIDYFIIKWEFNECSACLISSGDCLCTERLITFQIVDLIESAQDYVHHKHENGDDDDDLFEIPFYHFILGPLIHKCLGRCESVAFFITSFPHSCFA